MRAGTENIYGIVGLAKALEIAYASLEEDTIYIKELKEYFFKKLKANVPDVSVNGNFEDNSLHTVLNVSFPKTEQTDFLLYNLDIQGIAVSAGSACTSGSNQGSHVLSGINSSPERNSIRFSFSKMNTRAELDQVLEIIKNSL